MIRSRPRFWLSLVQLLLLSVSSKQIYTEAYLPPMRSMAVFRGWHHKTFNERVSTTHGHPTVQCLYKQTYGLDSTEELSWNIPKLLKQMDRNCSTDYRVKLEPLLISVYHAAIQARKTDYSVHSKNEDQASPSQCLPAHLSSMTRFVRTSLIDSDHEGCFRIFFDNDDDDCAHSKTSLPINVLFSLDQPLSFIRHQLSYQSDPAKKGGMMCDNTEAIVWCVQKDQHLEYVSNVLDNMPFAQLGMGNFPTVCEVELSLDTIQALQSLGVLDGDFTLSRSNTKTTALCKIRGENLNLIRSLLSFSGTDDDNEFMQGKQSLMKLIDHAVESVKKELLGNSNEPHLVLVANSIDSSIVAAALSTWKQQKLGSNRSNRQQQLIEDLLRQAVTVITFGAVSKNFCDGPAYIHISMYDDHLARINGATEKNPVGGGQDAVYLHSWSPYDNVDIDETNGRTTSLTGHDAHNMNACALQYLYLVMRINGITSFRQLYDAARFIDPRSILDINPSNFAIDYTKHKHGDLVIPPTIDDELLPAMICASGGDRWLWNPIPQDYDNGDLEDFLPDSEESRVYLEEFFGYNAFEEIYEICCNSYERSVD